RDHRIALPSSEPLITIPFADASDVTRSECFPCGSDFPLRRSQKATVPSSWPDAKQLGSDEREDRWNATADTLESSPGSPLCRAVGKLPRMFQTAIPLLPRRDVAKTGRCTQKSTALKSAMPMSATKFLGRKPSSRRLSMQSLI